MTPTSSPEKKPVTFPNDEIPWPLGDNPLRKESMLPRKLFEKAMEESKIDGDKLEDADMRDRMVSVRIDGGPKDDTKK